MKEGIKGDMVDVAQEINQQTEVVVAIADEIAEACTDRIMRRVLEHEDFAICSDNSINHVIYRMYLE